MTGKPPPPHTWRFTEKAWDEFWNTVRELVTEGLVDPDNLTQEDADLFYTVLAKKMLETSTGETQLTLDDCVDVIKVTLNNEVQAELARIMESN